MATKPRNATQRQIDCIKALFHCQKSFGRGDIFLMPTDDCREGWTTGENIFPEDFSYNEANYIIDCLRERCFGEPKDIFDRPQPKDKKSPYDIIGYGG